MGIARNGKIIHTLGGAGHLWETSAKLIFARSISDEAVMIFPSLRAPYGVNPETLDRHAAMRLAMTRVSIGWPGKTAVRDLMICCQART